MADCLVSLGSQRRRWQSICLYPMKSLLFSIVLFGACIFASGQTRANGLAINLATTSSQAASHAVPFLLYSVATGALFACGTAAAIAGITKTA